MKGKPNKEYRIKFVKGEGSICCIARENDYYATERHQRRLHGPVYTFKDKLYKRFTILEKLGKWIVGQH